MQEETAAAQDNTINRFFKFILMTFAFSSIWLNAITIQILYGFFDCFSTMKTGRANIPVFSKTTCVTRCFSLVNLSKLHRSFDRDFPYSIIEPGTWGSGLFFCLVHDSAQKHGIK